MSQKRKRGDRRRSIYIIPNLFTTGSLFFGFYSVMCSVQGRYSLAAALILFAAVMDALDGTVARMTNTTSRFGVEYDSLCDLLSFGAAPAVLVYLWALTPQKLRLPLPSPDDRSLGFGLIVAFIFLACGALRLARFNVSAGSRDPGFFQGLPIPGGAGIVAAAVLWHYRFPGPPLLPAGSQVLIMTIVLAFLMVSNLDFVSLKNKIFTKNNHPFETLAIIVIFLAFLIIKAKTVLLPLGFVYLASGPVVTVVRRLRRGGAKPSDAPDAEGDSDGEADSDKADPDGEDDSDKGDGD